MNKVRIAIDGPSGAGKSTISKAIAREFGFIYVDTGALYRAIGLFAYRCGIKPDEKNMITEMLKDISVSIEYRDGAQRIILNGEDVTEHLRTPEISMYASKVSAIPEVRSFLLEMQRSIAEENSVIMDGRDIGTVVIPNADVKIFLTASPEERARRRYEELAIKHPEIDYKSVLNDIIKRDKNDSERASAPLKAANDAVKVDTTGNTLEKSISILTNLIRERLQNVL